MSEFIDENFVGLLGVFLGVVGIVLASVFYLRGRRYKRLSFSYCSFPLIAKSVAQIPGFSASFAGNPVHELTMQKIFLWNSGTEMISKGDISTIDAIRVTLPETAQLLTCDVTISSALTNDISVTLLPDTPNTANISFDYFAPRQGAVLTLLHTGSEEDPTSVLGTIKGGGSPSNWRRSTLTGVMQRLILLTGVVLLLILLSVTMVDTWWLNILIVLLLSVLMTVIEYGLLYALSRRVEAKLERAFNGEFTASDFAQKPPGVGSGRHADVTSGMPQE